MLLTIEILQPSVRIFLSTFLFVALKKKTQLQINVIMNTFVVKYPALIIRKVDPLPYIFRMICTKQFVLLCKIAMLSYCH